MGKNVWFGKSGALMVGLSLMVGPSWAAQSDYPGYVTRAYKPNTSFLNPEGWSDNLPPHADANYYSANQLSAPSTTDRFDGNSLVLEGGKTFTMSGEALTFIGDGLVLGEGTQLYVNKTASLGGGLSGIKINGPVTVKGLAKGDKDFYKRDIVQGSGTGNMGLELTGSLTAAAGCELFVERLCGLGGYYADRTKSPRASGASGSFTLRLSANTAAFAGAVVVETNAVLQLTASGLPNGTVELGKYGSPEISLAPTYSGLAGGLSLYGTTESRVGTLNLNGGKATIPSGGTLEVGTIGGSGGVVYFTDATGCLALTGGVTSSAPIMLSFPVSYAYSSKTGFSYDLVRLTGDAAETVTAGDFVYDPARISVTGTPAPDHRYVGAPRVQLVIEPDGASARVVRLKLFPVVTAKGTGGLSSSAFSGEGSAAYWDDELPTHGDAEYLVCSRRMTLPAGSNIFPGNALMLSARLANVAMEISAATERTTISNLVVGTGDRTPNNYSFTLAAYNHDGVPDASLGSSGTTRLAGKVTLLDWTTNVIFQSYSKTLLKIESDIVSSEETTLHLSMLTTARTPISLHQLSGDNTGFRGRVDVGSPFADNSYVGCRVPSSDYRYGITLIVADGCSLGGARSAFTPDAMVLRNYSTVRFVDDVDVDEATRGWLVEGENKLVVDDGHVATLAVPITYNGVLRKTGAGTLALASHALFGDGEQATAPVSGLNRLILEAGALRPQKKDVVDGVALEVGAAAEIELDYNATDADLLSYGLYNVRGSLTASDGGVVCFAFSNAPDDGETRAVCTVSAAVATSLAAHLRVERPNGRVVPVRSETHGDEVTFYADFAKKGLLVIFK